MSAVLNWAAAAWRRVFCVETRQRLPTKEPADVDEAAGGGGGNRPQALGKPASTAVSTPPPPQRPNVHDTQGSAAPSPPAPEADLKPLPSQQDGESSACTPLLQPRKPGVAFVVGAGALRTPLGEVATNTRYIVDGEKVVGMANTVRKYAPHQAVVQHTTPFNERVEREVMRQLRAEE